MLSGGVCLSIRISFVSFCVREEEQVADTARRHIAREEPERREEE
jgi:hypothetical protein